MALWASLVLVLAATGLLVLGLLGDGGLVLLVLSIACSVAAGLVMGVGWRRRAVSRG